MIFRPCYFYFFFHTRRVGWVGFGKYGKFHTFFFFFLKPSLKLFFIPVPNDDIQQQQDQEMRLVSGNMHRSRERRKHRSGDKTSAAHVQTVLPAQHPVLVSNISEAQTNKIVNNYPAPSAGDNQFQEFYAIVQSQRSRSRTMERGENISEEATYSCLIFKYWIR